MIWICSCEILQYISSLQGTVKMEAAHFSKIFVPIYCTAWYHIPEDHDLNIHDCENLKSYNISVIHCEINIHSHKMTMMGIFENNKT
jgi:hypothetical protein